MSPYRLRAYAPILTLTVLATAAASALAAPTLGSTDDTVFYASPTVAPTGNHGDLISYRPTTANLGTGAVANKAWNVIYQSTDSNLAANVVSGTVLVPAAAWSGTGPRPVVLYAVGTQGLAQNCAPSRQFETGSEYENANINAALAKGYAVLVSDYSGYLNGGSVTYLAGQDAGQAVLDIFNAALNVPGAGVSASAPVAIWGYSQGGQSAGWAAELMASYAPQIKVVGVAAGGIPGNFIESSQYLNGNVGFAFLGMAIDGLQAEYPTSLPIALLENPQGAAALAQVKSECVFQALFQYMDQNISAYTNGNVPLSTLENIKVVNAVLVGQDLGNNKIGVPLYQYHGQADEFIPLDQDIALKNTYCKLGTNVQFDVYPSEHIVTQFQAAPTVMSWLSDRFAGKSMTGNCSDSATAPTSTANPGGGDLVVSLNAWPLNASVHLNLLGQNVQMPAASTFTATADVTSQKLNGSLSIPAFTTPISIIGLPIPTGLSVSAAGPTTGSVALDNSGVLHITGSAPVNITVTSLLGIPFGNCETATPVAFPLNFTGPIASLGDGNLTFTGTVAFPQIKGCLISGILSVLMSGAGQTFSFTVAPPAPVHY